MKRDRTEYYLKNKERIRKRHAEWRKKNIEKCSLRAKKRHAEFRDQINERHRMRYRSFEGRLLKTYNSMVRRTKQRGEEWLTGNEIIERGKFERLANKSEEYIRLYDAWVKTGYVRAYAPSVDRIDNTKGYIEGNIQFIPQRLNTSKLNNKKPKLVSQYVGVCHRYDRTTKPWYGRIWYDQGWVWCGKHTESELEAARSVNAKCIELGIPLKNPGIN